LTFHFIYSKLFKGVYFQKILMTIGTTIFFKG